VKRALAFAAGLVLASPWLALAEESEHAAAHGSEGWWLLLRHALNLAILVFVFVRFALPVLRDLMRQRAENLREQLGSAQAALEKAQRQLAELRTQLSRADDEARDLLADAERSAEAEQPLALERSRENAERLRADARKVADQEVQRARELLQAEAARLATELAAQLLRERLGPEDDRRLFDEFTGHVGRAS
jgi:F-type H+-transporting ATPase subunit b